jgi:hypothetical protein
MIERPLQNQPNSSLPVKAFQLLAFLTLLAMSIVQYNDPDPVFWIAFYGGCALLPFLGLFKLSNKLLFIACVLFGLYAAYISLGGTMEYSHHLQDESIINDMSPDKPYIEETREFFGVLIALALISINQLFTSTQTPQ